MITAAFTANFPHFSTKCIPYTVCMRDRDRFPCSRRLSGRKSVSLFRNSSRCSGGRNEISAVLNTASEKLSSFTEGVKLVEKETKYLFRTEHGGQVKVGVAYNRTNCIVSVEVSFLPKRITEGDLFLNWGMYRSDSSRWVVPDIECLDSHAKLVTLESGQDSVQVPFERKGPDSYFLKLSLDMQRAPFYLSFILHTVVDASNGDSWTRSHLKRNFCVPVGMGRGHPSPLGAAVYEGGLANFAIFSRNAGSVVLCLFKDGTALPSMEIELDPYINRTGDVWHVLVENVNQYVSYGYRCKGSVLWDKESRFHVRRVLLDPYAKILRNFDNAQESTSLVRCLGCISRNTLVPFDWTGDTPPCLPMEKLVVYRLNVSLFTKDRSSGLSNSIAGTFLGVVKKLEHFKNLGVNAVLLEPVFPFMEEKGPYFPYNFFSPMNSFGLIQDGESASKSMKTMVKALHDNGIEVFLEVVYSHTAEGGDAASRTVSFRGIDNSSYYITKSNNGREDTSALNCNHAVVQRMILDSLHDWVTEYHIDGFCFLNASSLLQGPGGEVLAHSPLIEAITFDPVLSKTKLIADCWSPLELSYKEVVFPHWKRWAEINHKFCYDVRNFLRGEGLLGNLATRLCGSGDIFAEGRGPGFSFNFVTRSFGLSLVDLVSFSGSEFSEELSWNCGEEGATKKVKVLETRLRQIRNFLFILFVSLGNPVLNMGDECGQSFGGSPLYQHRKSLDWEALGTVFGIQTSQYIAFLSSLRRERNENFQKRDFIKVGNLDWHDADLSQPHWLEETRKFVAVTLKKEKHERLSTPTAGDLYVSFNAEEASIRIDLPQLPENTAWFRLVDTALQYPDFFSMEGRVVEQPIGSSVSYEMMSHSCALFDARPL